jgi:integrase
MWLLTNIIPGQSDTYRHLQERVTALFAESGLRRTAGTRWQEHNLVFSSTVGTKLDSHNVRRAFRKVIEAAGLPPDDWTPREMRHSFVSLLSDSGVSLEAIARLVGHRGTSVTETVYRQQIRPVIEDGVIAMDRIFERGSREQKR